MPLVIRTVKQIVFTGARHLLLSLARWTRYIIPHRIPLRYIYVLTYIPIARQLLGKNISAGANARYNRIYIARQRIYKHASLTVEAVFSAWFMKSDYK
jgi:hypothetical protein